MVTREDKIILLKSIAQGTANIGHFKKELAILDGRVQFLVGLDLCDYENGKYDKDDLVFIKGEAFKMLAVKPTAPVEETYV